MSDTIGRMIAPGRYRKKPKPKPEPNPNAELIGHAQMCVRMKLKKDRKDMERNPFDERIEARVVRGQNTLRWLRRKAGELE